MHFKIFYSNCECSTSILRQFILFLQLLFTFKGLYWQFFFVFASFQILSKASIFNIFSDSAFYQCTFYRNLDHQHFPNCRISYSRRAASVWRNMPHVLIHRNINLYVTRRLACFPKSSYLALYFGKRLSKVWC